MQWFASAPSNIALIKYMGKQDGDTNLPLNASLSYTLDALKSSVSMEIHPGQVDFWEPLLTPGAMDFELSMAAQARFLQHLQRLKKHFNYHGAFMVRSSNNFPLGTGLASSASSFAALTKCAVLALGELTGQAVPSIEECAQLSRLGSGSSCRSFFGPWALWEGEQVQALDLPYPQLLHQVILVSHDEKEVSSSEAHQRIRTSPYYLSRPQRAANHLSALRVALESKNWHAAYQVCWEEFHDMHQLFTTCAHPFSYIRESSQALLSTLQSFWREHNDGPLVTMDAGPNIHLLYRPDQAALAHAFKCDHLLTNYDIL